MTPEEIERVRAEVTPVEQIPEWRFRPRMNYPPRVDGSSYRRGIREW